MKILQGMSREDIEKKMKAINMLRDGMTAKEVAEKLNLNKNTVFRYKREFNIAYKKPQEVPYDIQFKDKWNEAVNRIRSYYGFKPIK